MDAIEILGEFAAAAQWVTGDMRVERWRLDGGVRTYRPAPPNPKSTESWRKCRNGRLAQGLCPECPSGAERAVEGGKKRCDVCQTKNREHARAWRERQKAKVQ